MQRPLSMSSWNNLDHCDDKEPNIYDLSLNYHQLSKIVQEPHKVHGKIPKKKIFRMLLVQMPVIRQQINIIHWHKIHVHQHSTAPASFSLLIKSF